MIDGYSHCGLSKYLPVEDVLAVMRGVGVDRAVLCQYLGEYDDRYLAEVVSKNPTTFAAVCLVVGHLPRARRETLRLRQKPARTRELSRQSRSRRCVAGKQAFFNRRLVHVLKRERRGDISRPTPPMK